MDDWDDDYDDDEGEDARPAWRRPVVLVAAAAVLIALLGVGYVVMNKDDGNAADAGATTTQSATDSAPRVAATTTTAAGTLTSTPATTDARPSSSSTTQAATTTQASSTTQAATTTAPPETDTEAPPSTTVAAPPAGADAVTYATLPDGTPAPVIAVFGTDSNTLTGNVPDQASKDKLQALMIAYSKNPVPVNNLLTIDPTAPANIGVRVVELTSARFEPNSAEVQGFHALELDRVVSVMNALPNVTALVIGHADQIGSDAQNFKISAARAAAVVNYLVAKGIAPSRLSSRAVGDTDLLTLNDDAASLALNRRTEFVFYGLLTS